MNADATTKVWSFTLNLKKQKKLVRLIDPEPGCFPRMCGTVETVQLRTGTVLDVLKETAFSPAPRDTYNDYIHHDKDCAWYQWAMREIARETNLREK